MPKAPSRYNPYKNKVTAKFRRNLVLKNLFENKFITKAQYNSYIKEPIKLKKRKKIYLEDARYYVEDIRKDVVKKFGFEKVYKKGLNIKTPLNLKIQSTSTLALRSGLINYDRRKGWRGPLTNKTYDVKWSEGLEKFKLEKSINWELAIVKAVNGSKIKIETKNNKKGFIRQKDISWIKKSKNYLNIGDIIYVKNDNSKLYKLQQIPEVNGSIVVMDPYTGRVLAMSGGFSFLQSEFNRASQALRQPGSAFKPFIYALAIENNYKPSSLVLDAPLVLEQGEDLKLWKPENYGKNFMDFPL